MRCASGAGKVSYRAPRRVGRKIVQHHADHVRIWIMRIDEIAHAHGKIPAGSLIRDLHMAPRLMRIEEHEQIGRAVAAILAVVTLQAGPGAAGIGWRTSPISCVGLSSKQTTGRFGSASSA